MHERFEEPINCVYLIRNTVNNKCYVGITYNLIKRMYEHRVMSSQKPKRKLHKAIAKYGWDAFEVIVLHVNLTLESALDLEKHEIGLRGCFGTNGYNMTAGGEGCWRREVPDETRKKMRERQLGKKCSEETKEKLRNHNLGKKQPEEFKRAVSERHTGKVNSPETRQRISDAQKRLNQEWREQGTHKRGPTSEITKQRIREGHQRRKDAGIPFPKRGPRSPETSAKISAAQKGMKRSPEFCEKMRVAKLGTKQSPETIAKRSLAQMGRKFTEETRRKIRTRLLIYNAKQRAQRLQLSTGGFIIAKISA